MLYLEIMTLNINNSILADGIIPVRLREESREARENRESDEDNFARMQDADHHVRWNLAFKNMKITNRQNSRTEARKSIAKGVTNEKVAWLTPQVEGSPNTFGVIIRHFACPHVAPLLHSPNL